MPAGGGHRARRALDVPYDPGWIQIDERTWRVVVGTWSEDPCSWTSDASVWAWWRAPTS